MIQRSANYAYPDLPVETYKDEPGTWVGVSRRQLASKAETAFETRYFELEPGGYTSYEQHGHEHVVIVQRGTGMVLLGETWGTIGPGDLVHVSSQTPHRFLNNGCHPFGILCIVNRERDLPVLLDGGEPPHTSNP